MEVLNEKALGDVNGGASYMNMKMPKLKAQFERACRTKNMNKVMAILGELQARGEYAWAKETANSYGISAI